MQERVLYCLYNFFKLSRTGAQPAMSAPIPTPNVARLLFPKEAIPVIAIQVSFFLSDRVFAFLFSLSLQRFSPNLKLIRCVNVLSFTKAR